MLLTFQQLDPWLQFNPYLVTGYRPRMSIREALRSFFQWHNESVNVWTHALAACLVLYLALFPPTDGIGVSPRLSARAAASSSSNLLDVGPTTVFRCVCLLFFIMFLLSVVYHLMMPCTITSVGYNRLLRCDVIGGITSLTGSAWSILYRGNACGSDLSCYTATSVLTISFASVMYRTLFANSCGAPERAKSIGIYCALRLATMLWMELPKTQTQGYHLAMNYHIASHLYIIVGGIINTMRFPEKHLYHALARGGNIWRFVGQYIVSSGEVDYTWNSHNLWHFFTVLSVTSTLFGCYYDLVEFELAKC